MVRRWRAATPLLRRTLIPVVWASLISVSLLAAFFLARRFAPDGRAAETLGLLWGLAVALLAAALWLGLMRRRLLVGEVLGRLTARLSNGVDAGRLQEVLRTSLDDPTLEVLIPDGPVRWLDSGGHSHSRLPAGPGRSGHADPGRQRRRGGRARPRRSAASRPGAAVGDQRPRARDGAPPGRDEQAGRRDAPTRAVTPADRRSRRPGARADRARPPRRGTAAPDDVADSTVPGRGAAAAGQRRRRRRRPRPGQRGRADARRAAVPRARRLPGDPERPRAGGGAAQPGGHHHRPAAPADRRAHAPADRARDRRVLHLPRSRAERDQARAVRVRGVGPPAPERRRPVDRGP